MKKNLISLLSCSLLICSCDRDRPRAATSQPDPATQQSEDIIDNRPRAPMALFRRVQLVDYPLSLKVPEK